MSQEIWTATSIHSACHALPVKPRGSDIKKFLKTSSLETNSPAYVSRHASSLAMPQEDSMCGDGPTVSGDYIDKNSLRPEHTSRHASSLAVPQEDSMCGDGPTIPELIDITQNDRTGQHTVGLSTTRHALAASIALRSFGVTTLLATTQSVLQHCMNQSEPHTVLRRLTTNTGTGCVSKYRTKQSHATCRLLFAR